MAVDGFASFAAGLFRAATPAVTCVVSSIRYSVLRSMTKR
jgi:hypothetical protein